MTSSIDTIRSNMAAVEAMIAREAEASARSVAGRTSRFWSDLFDERPNFPDITAFLGFRRDNFGYGMADERQGGLEREREHFLRNREIFRFSVSPTQVAMVDEPVLGAPYAFEADGLTRSAAFWVNAATAHAVRDAMASYGPAHPPLNVLEIGAGWGAAAYQLHHLLDIASYTIVDLPQNLLLSTTYLASTLERPLNLIGVEGPPVAAPSQRAIVGLLPGALPRLATKFDLILNSFSLQEMDRDTVEAYLAWIEGALAEDGLFVSFNAHGKAGIRRPADYRYDRFHLHDMRMFRRFPSGFLNTIPTQIVASRRTSSSPAHDGAAIDAIACLHQFGLDAETQPFAKAITTGSVHRAGMACLNALGGFFTPDPTARRAALESPEMAGAPLIRDYLRAQDLLIAGDAAEARTCLERSLINGLAGFARLRAEVMCAVLSGRRDLPKHDDAPGAAMAYPDVARMLAAGDISPMLHQFERVITLA